MGSSLGIGGSTVVRALLISIALLAALAGCSGDPTPTETPGTSPTPTATTAATQSPAPSPTPTATATATVVPTATPSPTPTCLLPTAPPEPQHADAFLRGKANAPVTLNPPSLFPQAAPGGTWSQLHMEEKDLAYASFHESELTSHEDGSASFTPPYAGNYRFAYQASGSSSELTVGVEVYGPLADLLTVRGVAFADLFGQIGGPEFDLDPVDPNCQRLAFNHGYSAATRIHANWTQITPAMFMQQLAPLPVYEPQVNGQSLTDDGYYAELVDAARAHGMEVANAEQDAPGIHLPEGEWQRRDEERARDEWWDAWFEQWTEWDVQRAARAEANGVKAYIPFVWADDTFMASDYEQHWRDLIAAIREVFSGQVGMAISNHADSRLTFLDAVDFVIVGLDGSYYPNAHVDPIGQVLTDRDHPTFEQLMTINRERFELTHEVVGETVPVYYMFAASSSNGQRNSEVQGERDTFITDFAEQVLYYEAFFASVQEQPWIKGVVITGMDWFDQYERPSEQWYFDATNEVSPRSKPAEDVARIWFTQAP